jgi:hypothetical protein
MSVGAGRFRVHACESLMRIAIVTLFTKEIADFGEIGAANKQAYARRHAYDCFEYREQLDKSRHPAWSKLDVIRRHLSDYDWVFWTDADSLVMNSERKLESIIAGHEHKDMILTWEVGPSPVNTGQWLVQSTAWSADVLSVVGQVASPNRRPRWFEQGALSEWLGTDETRWCHLAVVHPRIMNATPPVKHFEKRFGRKSRWRRGDFIIHFWPLERKREAILDMMIEYDELSRSQPSSFVWLTQRWFALKNGTPCPSLSWNEIEDRCQHYRDFIGRK